MRWAFGTGTVLLLFDQATKILAVGSLARNVSRPVIEGFFYLTLVKNPGIAFGLLPQYSRIFVYLSFATIAAIIFFYRKVFSRGRAHQIAGGLILGGAAGNLIDRILRGHVVDFLDFRWGDYRWPAFNLADSAICVGVGLLMVLILKSRPSQKPGLLERGK